jgi:CTP synthase (UTP-ammonia lyase)
MKIGLIGDYSQTVTAHRAIPISIDLALEKLSQKAQIEWISSTEIPLYDLEKFAGIWCVPASPYRNMENVLRAITFARKKDIPFLGTCGGYQHAALEFARNALGYSNAENGEVNPEATMPLISALACRLVEVSDRIHLSPNSKIARIYNESTISEEYRCGYGVNREYLRLYEGSEMKFAGFDADGDPRTLEIPSNKFFIGTAFQPERAGLRNQTHPIVLAFLQAAASA